MQSKPLTIRPIDQNLVDLALEHFEQHGEYKILDPVTQLADRYDAKRVTDRITTLKNGKFITTKRNRMGNKIVYICPTPTYIELVTGRPSSKHALNGHGTLKPKKGEERPIYALVDWDNINIAEQTNNSKDKLSYGRLKEYLLSLGPVILAEVVLPHNFFGNSFQSIQKGKRIIRYLESAGWYTVNCADSQKNNDQVDSVIMDRIRRIQFWNRDTVCYIISRDKDYAGIQKLNKDRRLDNVVLVNPFLIPEVQGMEEHEMDAITAPQTRKIMDLTARLTPHIDPAETTEQLLMRYTLDFFKQQEDELKFHNKKHFVKAIETNLRDRVNRRLQTDQAFPKFAAEALIELGVIFPSIEQNGHGFKVRVQKDHPIFGIALSPEWIARVLHA